jgi:hypothetical protein
VFACTDTVLQLRFPFNANCNLASLDSLINKVAGMQNAKCIRL